jgi:hypothetical protein
MNSLFSRERLRVQLVCSLPGGSWSESRVDQRGPSVRWKKEGEKEGRVISEREKRRETKEERRE